MKVESFITCVKNYMRFENFDSCREELYFIEELIKFYSQEFKPEMEGLTEYLNYKDVYLDEEDIENIISIVRKHDEHEANKGMFLSRINHNEREKAFYEQWMKENNPIVGINNGNGILQDLFIESSLSRMNYKVLEVITKRDRMIVATVIQWLGSNCGMSFLHESLKKCGYRIEQIDSK